MDKAAQTMIDNLHKNTDKTLEQWVDIVRNEAFEKHGQIIKYLKEKHGLINLSGDKDLDNEIFDWMRKAYEQAG